MEGKEIRVFLGKFFRRKHFENGALAGSICIKDEPENLPEKEFTVLESAELLVQIMELVKKSSHENGKKIPTYQLSKIIKCLEVLVRKEV